MDNELRKKIDSADNQNHSANTSNNNEKKNSHLRFLSWPTVIYGARTGSCLVFAVCSVLFICFSFRFLYCVFFLSIGRRNQKQIFKWVLRKTKNRLSNCWGEDNEIERSGGFTRQMVSIGCWRFDWNFFPLHFEGTCGLNLEWKREDYKCCFLPYFLKEYIFFNTSSFKLNK